MEKFKAISLFSGCGGFDYGATKAGVDVIWANDRNPVAASGYKSLLPDTEFVLGDIRQVSSFPQADILLGCYPCSGFSVAPRRRWKTRKARARDRDWDLLGTNGNFMYLEFMKVLLQSRPMFFFVENVHEMVSSYEGCFFHTQIETFKRHGYNVVHKLLFAPDYGVAQSRLRVFIVGTRNDIAKDFTYSFLPPTHGDNMADPYSDLRQAIGDMPHWPVGEFYTKPFSDHYFTRNRKRLWEKQSFTIVANASYVPLHPSGLPMAYIDQDKWALQGSVNRRLSWRECARIQGLPDKLKIDGGLVDKYKVVGNAAPSIFGKILLTPIVNFFRRW